MIHHGRPYVRHSEQEMVDCTAGSCSGGWEDYVYEYSKQNGTSSNADYSYTASDGTCSPTPNKVSKVSDYGYLPSNVVSMENYLESTGPIAVSVSAGNSIWYNYTGGIVTTDCPTYIDHGVVIVGAGAEESTVTESYTFDVDVCKPASNS